MFLFQEKENYEVSSSSSSDMISFDLSNGDPYPPHLAVALDDDQYVEFQVEELADFPSNPDEEERVRIIKKLDLFHIWPLTPTYDFARY